MAAEIFNPGGLWLEIVLFIWPGVEGCASVREADRRSTQVFFSLTPPLLSINDHQLSVSH